MNQNAVRIVPAQGDVLGASGQPAAKSLSRLAAVSLQAEGATWATAPCPAIPVAEVVTTRASRETPGRAEPARPMAGGGASGRAQSPLAKLHYLLRGRYAWALLLALVGALTGAAIGYRSAGPVYQSIGLVRIKPHLPKVMYPTEQSSVIPMYEAFVMSQVALINGERVLDLARQRPEWKSANGGEATELDSFRSRLVVDHPRGSELISVAFVDAEAERAMAGVRAVMGAYQQVFADSDIDGVGRRKVLEDRIAQLTKDLAQKAEEVRAAAPFGPEGLQQMYHAKVSQLTNLEAEIKQAETALASIQTNRATAAELPSLSAEEIGVTDQVMHEFIRQKQETARKLEALKVRHGDKHPLVLEARAAMEGLQRDIESRAVAVNQVSLQTLLSATPAAGETVVSAEAMRRRLENSRTQYERTKKEVADLGTRGVQLQKVQGEADLLRKALDDTRGRIEQLEVESSVGGRLSVLSMGDRPLGPFKDRRMAFAGGGAFGGVMLGMGIVVLMGLMDRRLRNITDAEQGLRRINGVLGVVPVLPAGALGRDEAAAAVGCIHRIRARLQIHQRGPNHRAIAITSCAPGDGKTSLVLALGMSFAASNSRTLLIDCDMEGAALSAKVRAMLGQTPQDEAGPEQRTGLLGMLAGEPLDRCIVETGTPGLAVLPLGSAGTGHLPQLSPTALRRVLDAARQSYDAVLIDTGPVLASLDATIASAEADQVVLVVTRGVQRPTAEKAVEQVIASGGHLAGMIFNRARTGDVQGSRCSSTSGAGSVERLVFDPAAYQARVARLGPIAAAIASCTSRHA